MYVCIYVFTECIEISICIYTHGFTVSISVCYIICISVYLYIYIYVSKKDRKTCFRFWKHFIGKTCKIFGPKVVAEYDVRPFAIFRFPSSRPNSCFPFAYCTALPQGIPSKYIKAHVFAWRKRWEQKRVRELKSRSQKACVFSFYRGAEHASLCLKFYIEKEIDSKKNVDLNWNRFWLNLKPNNNINAKVMSIQI